MQPAQVLTLLNRVQNHLTAGIVSNDQHFIDTVLGNTQGHTWCTATPCTFL